MTMHKPLMPAVFIGHGSPMIALEHNRYTKAWREFGRSIPTPEAILVVSAHWYTSGTSVTSMQHPKTIHDFQGFPSELTAVRYPAAGSPELAANVADLLAAAAKPTQVSQDSSGWGLDHGTWSILVHMYPDANVPVVQLSIDANASDHLALGAALAPLREQGILIIGSGNVVHNLSLMQWGKPDGFDWATEFDDDTTEMLTTRPGDITSLRSHRQYRLAAPTPEHFLPLHYIAGLAGAADTKPTALITGQTMGSVSMTSYVVR